MSRTFTHEPAVRAAVPIRLGLVGPSSSGKTYSALRLATGIQSVAGGEIFVIDTEARRSLLYADRFRFQAVPFMAPFSPDDYLEAIRHCVDAGAKTIVIDSMSHEHEGPGGVLEWHERELDARAGDDRKRREKLSIGCWAKPKAARRRLINEMVQLGVNVICCWRAKEKLRIRPGRDPEQRGWQPIGADEYVYEMTACCLLYPGCDGVPTWDPEYPDERIAIKWPGDLRNVLKPGQQLDEATGAALARWAAGEPEADAADGPDSHFAAVRTAADLQAAETISRAWWDAASQAERKRWGAKIKAAKAAAVARVGSES